MRNPKADRMTSRLTFDFPSSQVGSSRLVRADCFRWLEKVPGDTIHAVVTDPPYGVKEYERDQLVKRANGKGGIWRIPPSFDGSNRQPLPRFTALRETERTQLRKFFFEWGGLVLKALRPGGHVFIATNAFVSQLVFGALIESGLEFRGELIRLVRTLRGGDRPKNAESEFSGVSSMAKGCYEPWGILRKPLLPGMRVSDCLREFQTGGLRRFLNDKPFEDVIVSERTPRRERAIANHPSLKPQSLMRRLVFASLPLGEGIVLDPFAGAGSTVAAANAIGLEAIGVEREEEFYDMAKASASRLSKLRLPDIDPLVGVDADEMLFQPSGEVSSGVR